MKVSTVIEDRGCVFMDGYIAEQLHSAIGVALAGIDEQVNAILSTLNRLPEDERSNAADETMSEIMERIQWAQMATGGAV